MKSPGRTPFRLSCAALALLAGARLEAQPAGEDVLFEAGVPSPEAAFALGGDHVKVLAFEEGFETRQVKGAPYQAEAVTEIVQTLADGNRIVRKTSAMVARDSEGRTRRETSLAADGALAPAEERPRTAFLNDPVAGTRYLLDLDERVARRLPAAPTFHWKSKDGAKDVGGEGAPHAAHRGMVFKKVHEGAGMHVEMLRKELPGEAEPLGTQVIEGVEAEGTRHRITIEAGEIGNERPIEIVNERWYSPELQAVVLSRRSDPRLGETTYRLLNISRAEPDRALFEVPADFTVRDDAEGGLRRRLHILKQDPQPE